LLADAAERVTLAAVCTMLVAIVVVSVGEVFFRYVLSQPLVWYEEGDTYAFLWLCFLGIPVLVRRGRLLTVHLLTRSLNEAQLAVYEACLGILVLLPMFALLSWQSLFFLGVVADERSASLGLPVWLLLIPIPTSGILSVFFAFDRLLSIFVLKKPPHQKFSG